MTKMFGKDVEPFTAKGVKMIRLKKGGSAYGVREMTVFEADQLAQRLMEAVKEARKP